MIPRLAVTVLVCSTGAAQAEVPYGLWQSPPDATGLVVHVRIKPCGAALCGRVERAKDVRGYDKPSRAVGRKMLVDLLPVADGSFAGQVWEPAQDRMRMAKVRLQGDVLQMHSCDDTKCRDEIWKKLR